MRGKRLWNSKMANVENQAISIITLYRPTYGPVPETYQRRAITKVDDAEALERWLEGEEDAENEEVAGTSAGDAGDATLPDDNISQYGGDDSGDDA